MHMGAQKLVSNSKHPACNLHKSDPATAFALTSPTTRQGQRGEALGNKQALIPGCSKEVEVTALHKAQQTSCPTKQGWRGTPQLVLVDKSPNQS